MRAALYARYSSDLQRPASIEDQLRECRAYVQRRGWTEVAVFTDTEVPGTVTQRRPGYQALQKAARSRQFDVVVTDELSRLARRGAESFALHDRLRFWGIGLVCLLEGLDSLASPEAARAITAIKSYTNEIEGEANAHRSRRGLRGRVLAGLHAGGAPYGYRTRALHDDKPGDPPGTGPVRGFGYIIHEAEAETTRRIFRLYAQGVSTRRIAAMLNAEGVPPPGARWRDREGARRTWCHSAIHGDRRKGTGILNNQKYVGRIVWNRSTWPRDPERDGKQVRRELPTDEWVVQDAPALRIVPQELWEAVKERQQKRSEGAVGRAAHACQPRLLSGLLVCGKCGSRYVLRGGRTYSCATRQNRGESVCDCKATVNAATAEQEILDGIEKLFATNRLFPRLTDRVRERLAEERGRRNREQRRATELKRDLGRVEDEISRLVEAIAKGVLVEDLTERMRAAEARRQVLRAELAAAVEVPPVLEVLPGAVAGIVADLQQMLADGRIERVKATLHKLVGQIEVHERPRGEGKRPGARLRFRGYWETLLELANVTSVGSPGGIRTRDLMAENHAS